MAGIAIRSGGPSGRALFRLGVSTDKVVEADTALDGIRNGTNRALSAAINATTRKMRSAAVRSAKAGLALLDPKSLDKRFRTRNATANKLTGDVWITGRPFAFSRFKLRDTRNPKGWGTTASGQGVFATTYKDQGEQQHPHAFSLFSAARGGAGVFERQIRGPGSGPERHKLRFFGALKSSEVFGRLGITKQMQSVGEAELPLQIDKQITRLLAAKK